LEIVKGPDGALTSLARMPRPPVLPPVNSGDLRESRTGFRTGRNDRAGGLRGESLPRGSAAARDGLGELVGFQRADLLLGEPHVEGRSGRLRVLHLGGAHDGGRQAGHCRLHCSYSSIGANFDNFFIW
jgi:hypothetical protein